MKHQHFDVGTAAFTVRIGRVPTVQTVRSSR